MKYVLYHGRSWSPGALAEALGADQVELRVANAAAEIRADGRPTAYLLDPPSRASVTPQALAGLRDSGIALLVLGAPGEQDVPASLPAELLRRFCARPRRSGNSWWPCAPRSSCRPRPARPRAFAPKAPPG
jgi:hypothetical protein